MKDDEGGVTNNKILINNNNDDDDDSDFYFDYEEDAIQWRGRMIQEVHNVKNS